MAKQNEGKPLELSPDGSPNLNNWRPTPAQ
jgi:hypothetical protein